MRRPPSIAIKPERNRRSPHLIADTQPANVGGSGPRMISRLILPFEVKQIVLISMRRSLMAKPGLPVAMIVVAGGFLKYDSQTSLKPGTSSASVRYACALATLPILAPTASRDGISFLLMMKSA